MRWSILCVSVCVCFWVGAADYNLASWVAEDRGQSSLPDSLVEEAPKAPETPPWWKETKEAVKGGWVSHNAGCSVGEVGVVYIFWREGRRCRWSFQQSSLRCRIFHLEAVRLPNHTAGWDALSNPHVHGGRFSWNSTHCFSLQSLLKKLFILLKSSSLLL